MTLALRGRLPASQVAGYLEKFEITNQHTILEYFVNEVLEAQPADLQIFLLRTSLLNHLTGPLCQAVTHRADSDRVLDYLVNTNLFLEVSDPNGQWYRYHALFGEAMRYEAKRQLGATVVNEVLERAGQWFEQQGKLEEAVEAFLMAHQWSRAAELIEQFMHTQSLGSLNSVEIYTVRLWAEQLPEEVLNAHPNIRLNYAVALLFLAMRGPVANSIQYQIEQALERAEVCFQADHNLAKLGEIMAFRSLLAIQKGDINQAVAYASQALQWLPQGELTWRSWSLGVGASAAFFDGDLTTARTQLLEARALGEIQGNRFYLRANAGMLCGVHWVGGELQQVVFYVNNMLKEAREENDQDDVAHAQIMVAQLSYEWNKLDEAQQAAQEALEIARHFADAELEVEVYVNTDAYLPGFRAIPNCTRASKSASGSATTAYFAGSLSAASSS